MDTYRQINPLTHMYIVTNHLHTLTNAHTSSELILVPMLTSSHCSAGSIYSHLHTHTHTHWRLTLSLPFHHTFFTTLYLLTLYFSLFSSPIIPPSSVVHSHFLIYFNLPGPSFSHPLYMCFYPYPLSFPSLPFICLLCSSFHRLSLV